MTHFCNLQIPLILTGHLHESCLARFEQLLHHLCPCSQLLSFSEHSCCMLQMKHLQTHGNIFLNQLTCLRYFLPSTVKIKANFYGAQQQIFKNIFSMSAMNATLSSLKMTTNWFVKSGPGRSSLLIDLPLLNGSASFKHASLKSVRYISFKISFTPMSSHPFSISK